VAAVRLRRRRAGEPAADIQLQQRIRVAPLPRSAGSWRVAVMGPKGGSGKTPTAATLGLNLAELRGETAAVVDANTHLGTLRRRLVLAGPNAEVPLSMLAMANIAATGQLAPEWPVLSRYCDLVGRLRVFANTGVDPALVEHMTGEQYRDVIDLLSRAAQLVVSDLGTSTAGEVAVAALDAADQLVLCTELRRDALEIAIEYLSALYGDPVSYRPDPEDYSSIADGRYAELATRAIVVVAPGGGDQQALSPLLDWFTQVTSTGRDGGRVVVVPFDAHIARGEQIQLEQLQPATRLAYLQIAAHVVDNFALGRLGDRRLPPAPGILPQLAVDPSRPAPRAAEPGPAANAPAWPPPTPRAEQAGAVPGRRVPAVASPTGTATAAVWAGGRIPEAAAELPRAARPTPSTDRPMSTQAEETATRLALAPKAAAAGESGMAETSAAPGLQVRTGPFPAVTADAPATAADGQRMRVRGVASLVLGRDLLGVLGVEHTEGEVCTGGCPWGCGWPVPPPSAGAGERA
jgi:MinD-like ATPase involved in chromosome partitioning or flagellar assembly